MTTADKGGSVRFVGRERELRQVEQAMTEAAATGARLVAVTGEAGIGKTTLCRRIAARAANDGWRVAMTCCWPGADAPPLWPWPEILRILYGPRAHDLPPATERFAAFTAVAQALRETGSPALIVLDDAHDADSGTLLLARFLARALATTPLVMILACREDAARRDDAASREDAARPDDVPRPDAPARSGDLARRDDGLLDEAALVVRLGPFSVTETAAFLGHERLESGLLAALHRITRGNPLFLRRLSTLGPPAEVSTLGSWDKASVPGRSDEASVRGRSDGASVPGRSDEVRAPGSPDEVSALSVGGVRAAVRRAADGLGAPARRLLGAAALLGRSAAIAEAAVAAGLPQPDAWDLLPPARAAGLIELTGMLDPGTPARLTFTHELVREALLDTLPVTERLGVHARMADLLEHRHPADPAVLARYAHHATGAAPRSRQDADRAVTACRAAAAAMLRGLSYERAAALLETAVSVREQGRLAGPVAPLLVERAEAVLMCGRLSDARAMFDAAAQAATGEGDVERLARAAIGLGGVWVDEHRMRIEWERVTGVQRRALAALPATESRLRARLTVRLAAEEVYQGAPVAPVLAALEQARRTRDGEVLAEALSLTHHALLTPGYAHTRLPLAEELIKVATGAGKGMLALMGLCWRTVDLFLLGDPRAERSLAELRERAEFLTCKSIGYIAEAIDVMLTIRAGRLDEAESKALTCYELGEQVGDADAPAYLAAHLSTIRWAQGREAEVLDMVGMMAISPTLVPAEFAFRATVACFTAAAGRHDEARTLLARLTTTGLPESSTWLAGVAALAEASHLIGDAELARRVYPLLEPYADLPVMASLATVCLGSVRRPLGLAALAMGDPHLAADHLTKAVEATRLLGNRPVTALATANLADAMTALGDLERASALLAEAAAAAGDMGMHVRAERWTHQRHTITHREGVIRRDGRTWVFILGTGSAAVPDMVGVRHLVTLLLNPGTPISALDLATGDDPASMAASARQPVLDERAMAAYRTRARQLVQEIAEADRDADTGRAGHLRAQLDALMGELRAATGKGGRSRSFADPGERARTAVRKAVKRAIDEITNADPAIGAAITATVTTGGQCRYSPTPPNDITWSF